jgi:hypothetical protein
MSTAIAADALPQSYSADDIYEALRVNRKALARLVKSGRVGYIRVGRSRRYLPEHVGQIVAAIEVKPRQASDDLLARIGVTANGAARRRRSA